MFIKSIIVLINVFTSLLLYSGPKSNQDLSSSHSHINKFYAKDYSRSWDIKLDGVSFLLKGYGVDISKPISDNISLSFLGTHRLIDSRKNNKRLGLKNLDNEFSVFSINKLGLGVKYFYNSQDFNKKETYSRWYAASYITRMDVQTSNVFLDEVFVRRDANTGVDFLVGYNLVTRGRKNSFKLSFDFALGYGNGGRIINSYNQLAERFESIIENASLITISGGVVF